MADQGEDELALLTPRQNHAVLVARVYRFELETEAANEFLVLLALLRPGRIQHLLRVIAQYLLLVVLVLKQLVLLGPVHIYFLRKFLLGEVPNCEEKKRQVREVKIIEK